MLNQETKEIINIGCNILTSVGTVGAVILALCPNIFKSKRISIIAQNLEDRAAAINRPPVTLQYSESSRQSYSLEVLDNTDTINCISENKVIAKMQLKYLWRVIAHTNIKEFQGRLSNNLIEGVL